MYHIFEKNARRKSSKFQKNQKANILLRDLMMGMEQEKKKKREKKIIFRQRYGGVLLRGS